METIDYFLRRYREDVIRKRKAMEDIDAQLAELEAQLRREQGIDVGTGATSSPVTSREIQEMAAD